MIRGGTFWEGVPQYPGLSETEGKVVAEGVGQKRWLQQRSLGRQFRETDEVLEKEKKKEEERRREQKRRKTKSIG